MKNLKQGLFFTIFIFIPYLLLAQLTSEDTLKIEYYYTEALQADEKGDFEVTMSMMDSLIRLCIDKKDWYMAYIVGAPIKANFAVTNNKLHLYKKIITETCTSLDKHELELGVEGKIAKINLNTELGNYYTLRGSYSRAQDIYESILSDLTKNSSFHYESTPTVLLNLSSAHKGKGNYIQALRYAIESRDSFLANPNKAIFQAGYEGLLNKKIADIYALVDNSDLAKEYYEKAIKFNEGIIIEDRNIRNRVTTLYSAYAKFLAINKEHDSAIDAIKISLSYHTKGDPVFEESYRILGEIYLENKDYENALIYFKKSIAANRYTDKNYPIAKTYAQIGQVLRDKKQWHKALEYYQKALINIQDNFNSTDFCENPMDINQISVKKDAIKIFHKKAITLMELGKKLPAQLTCAFNTIQIAIELLDDVRTNNLSDADKHAILKENYQIFEDAIKISLAQPKGLGKAYAFEVAEKSKASQLLSAVRNTQIRNFYVPDSLIDLEEQYKFELLTLEEQESKTNTPSGEFLSKQKKLDDLIINFKNNYPDYFELRHNTKVISAENVKGNLEYNKILIEYFIGQNQTYVFLIQKDTSIKVVSLDITEKDLGELTQELLFSIYLPKITPTIEQQKSLKAIYTKSYADSIYAANAFKLYEYLIKPIEFELEGNSNLEIIPDGVLNYLPFDALIQKRVSPKMLGLYENETDYKYLARDYQISYCYSATLMDLMSNNKSQSQKELLVLHSEDFVTQAESIKDVFEQYNFLEPFVNVVNEKADKDQLKKHSKEYKYLHFSVHGVINNEAPSQSYLALRPTVDGDSLLYLKDIYSLSFPADMVITSACNAGVGPLTKGEGLLSLARGFAYSGAKSLITTLWEIKGGASNQLLKEFYNQIKEGETKDKALFLAKKANLNSTAYAHPYYWAGFIPIGNMEAIQMPFLSWNKLILASLFILMGGVFLLFRKK